MTPEEIRASIEYLEACLRDMHTAASERSLDEAEASRWAEGIAERDRLVVLLERHNDVARFGRAPASVEPGGPAGAPNVIVRDDPFDLSELRLGTPPSEFRSRAFRAIETAEGLSDSSREAAEALVRRADTRTGALARHVLATGSEGYRSAFQKLIAGQPHMMDEGERQALEAARALSLTDANGGYAVPFTLDPTIISTRSVSTNPFRRIATVKTTVTDQWQGVTSGGMSVSWDGEGAEVSDDSPTLAAAPVPVHKAQGFALGSIEVSGDWAGLEGDLREMIAEGKDDAEAIVFATGSGVNQPTGITKALDGTASEVSPATPETFAVADLYALEEALPPKYRLAMLDGSTQSNRASWVANRAIYNRSRQFDTAGGAALWERIGAGLPPQLLGYNAFEASAMDGAWDAAATADNFVLVLGDFRYYVIADRVGLSVEYIPHVFGDNGRPTGQRGWYCYWRVGGDSVNDDAFRMLNIATAA